MKRRIDWPLVALAAAVNGLVMFNALAHSPFVGYDALDHLSYIPVLAAGRLPTPDDTGEFFAPPLPYALPAWFSNAVTARRGYVAKIAQAQNVLWSLVLTVALVRWCRAISPADPRFARWALLLLGSMPVYYKSMAFVRGEPLTAALSVVMAVGAASAVTERGALAWWLAVGAVGGLALLSKQWGAMTLMAVLLFMATAPMQIGWRRRLAGLTLCAGTAALVAGGFYWSLTARFGSPAAFIAPASPSWSWSNRSPGFIGLTGSGAVLASPVRPIGEDDGPDLLLPVFYADFWGDYWCYWVVRGRDPETGGWASGKALSEREGLDDMQSNRAAMTPYLARAGLVGMLPTLLIAGGWWQALRGWRDRAARAGPWLALLVLAVTAAGYVALLYRYPDLGVKATYQLHAVPFAAVLGAVAIRNLSARWPRVWKGVRLALLAGVAHNLPLFVTRFVWW